MPRCLERCLATHMKGSPMSRSYFHPRRTLDAGAHLRCQAVAVFALLAERLGCLASLVRDHKAKG